MEMTIHLKQTFEAIIKTDLYPRLTFWRFQTKISSGLQMWLLSKKKKNLVTKKVSKISDLKLTSLLRFFRLTEATFALASTLQHWPSSTQVLHKYICTIKTPTATFKLCIFIDIYIYKRLPPRKKNPQQKKRKSRKSNFL
jgi:hypothetical protein